MATARTVMTTDVICVTMDTSIYEAIRVLVDNNVTGLPVIDEHRRLVGVVTEKDVLRLLYNVEDHQGTVEDFMSRHVVAFDQNDDLQAVVDSFKVNHFRRVPILDQGRLVGIVSRKDIVRYIREQQPAGVGEPSDSPSDELHWG
jgi:CBS domain-containing protein